MARRDLAAKWVGSVSQCKLHQGRFPGGAFNDPRRSEKMTLWSWWDRGGRTVGKSGLWSPSATGYGSALACPSSFEDRQRLSRACELIVGFSYLTWTLQADLKSGDTYDRPM